MLGKKVLVIMLVLALVISLVACASAPAPADTGGGTGTSSSGDSGGGSAAPTKNVKLALVIHGMNSSFFAKIGEGADTAGADLGIQVDVMAPSVPNQLTEQVNMIESCIAGGFDGIATTLWDPDGFTDVLKKAKDAGIPVVGFNQDAPDSGRLSFIGQDMVQSGIILGHYMFGEIMKGEGKLIVTNCAPANTALIEREEGLQIALKDYPNITYIESIDIGTDLTGAVGVIENAYMANPDTTAFIGVDVFSEAIGTFIESQGLTGKVYGGGYDLVEGTLNHIKNGNMQATIGQNPFLQGYYPMIILYLAKTFGYEPVNIDTGAFLVTSKNVDAQSPE